MKMLTFSILFLLSFSLGAQVKTGGGGGPDLESKDQRVERYEAEQRLKILFADLAKELVKVEKECFQRRNFPKDYNFIDSYYTLSLKKAGVALTEDDCKPSKAVSKCLSRPEIKSLLQQISHEPAHIWGYLEKEHKLDQKSGALILKFFGAP